MVFAFCERDILLQNNTSIRFPAYVNGLTCYLSLAWIPSLQPRHWFEVAAGDVAQVVITLTRKHLQEGEAQGPVSVRNKLRTVVYSATRLGNVGKCRQVPSDTSEHVKKIAGQN